MEDKNFFFITICYNNLDGLKKTIGSLVAQQYPHWQCAIIDGNSTDGTKPYLAQVTAADSRVSAVSEPDGGIYDAMNKGIGLISSKADYFCFLNSGDALYAADTLAALNQAIKQATVEPSIIYGDTCEVFADGGEVVKPANSPRALPKGMFCHHQSMFFHRRYAGLRYDLSYKLSGDYDYVVRAMQMLGSKDELLRVDMTLARFDMTGVSNSRRFSGIKEDYLLRVRNGMCSNAVSALYALRSLGLMGLKRVSYPLYLLMRSKTAVLNNQIT